MKNNKSKSLLAVLLFLGLYLTTVSIVSANPVVDSIVTTPEHPKPRSTFTVFAHISGKNIISVKVTVSECTEGPPVQCFKAHTNLPMSLNNDGLYEAEVTLDGTQASIDHVQYMFNVNDDGTNYNLTEDSWKTSLDKGTSTGGTKGSPGFEIILVILAVMIGVAIYRKKR